MKLNPKVHKNLVRMCKPFGIELKNAKGQYEEIDIIKQKLKRKIGY